MMTGSEKQQTFNQISGFPCPRCKNMLRFPLQALLLQQSIFCSQCGLELVIDLEHSAPALDELQRYIAGQDAARKILDENDLG